ncbi:MAG: winged helix-turn-helix domain-containing protein [Candidatus Pacearchaeota archaeon]|nr:winged helix-turn-helix domain-containing protein [Candidatus Pacearchaeota archaeon]
MSKKEEKEIYDKEKRRLSSMKKMKPEQTEVYAKNLLSRMQRKSEIRKKIFEILSSEENLAIADIQRKLGINRNTFNYWINMLEKEGWIKRKSLELEGEERRGRPKTLILNKKRIKEAEQYSYRRYKSFEEGELKSILVDKILVEIKEQQPSDKQHQKLIEMFKQFGKDNFGAKLIFLLYDDFIKIDYKLSLTDKGKAYLKKHKK